MPWTVTNNPKKYAKNKPELALEVSFSDVAEFQDDPFVFKDHVLHTDSAARDQFKADAEAAMEAERTKRVTKASRIALVETFMNA